MKVLDILEARHHIGHPVVDNVLHILNNVPSGGDRFSDMELTKLRRFNVKDHDYKEVEQVLTRLLGRPIFKGEETDDVYAITVWRSKDDREIVYYHSPSGYVEDGDIANMVEVYPRGHTSKEMWHEHDIHEASVLPSSRFVDWVRQQFHKIKTDKDRICLGNEEKVSSKNFNQVLADLSKAFGKPKIDPQHDSPYEGVPDHFTWRLGGDGGYRIELFLWGAVTPFRDDKTPPYVGICVMQDWA